MFTAFYTVQIDSDFVEICGDEITLYLNKKPHKMKIKALFPRNSTIDKLLAYAEQQEKEPGNLILDVYRGMK